MLIQFLFLGFSYRVHFIYLFFPFPATSSLVFFFAQAILTFSNSSLSSLLLESRFSLGSSITGFIFFNPLSVSFPSRSIGILQTIFSSPLLSTTAFRSQIFFSRAVSHLTIAPISVSALEAAFATLTSSSFADSETQTFLFVSYPSYPYVFSSNQGLSLTFKQNAPSRPASSPASPFSACRGNLFPIIFTSPFPSRSVSTKFLSLMLSGTASQLRLSLSIFSSVFLTLIFISFAPPTVSASYVPFTLASLSLETFSPSLHSIILSTSF